MSKKLFLFSFLGFLLFYFQSVSVVKAAVDFTLTPPNLVIQQTGGIAIQVDNLRPNQDYKFKIKKDNDFAEYVTLPSSTHFILFTSDSASHLGISPKLILCPLMASRFNQDYVFRSDNCNQAFLQGNYTLTIYNSGESNPLTSKAFSVAPPNINISFSPSSLTTRDTNGIGTLINGLETGATGYQLSIKRDGYPFNISGSGLTANSSGSLSLFLCPSFIDSIPASDTYTYHFDNQNCHLAFRAGNYTVTISRQQVEFKTSNPFVVSSQIVVNINFSNGQKFTTSDDIKIEVPGLPDDNYRAFVKNSAGNILSNTAHGILCDTSSNGILNYNLSTYLEGSYTIEIRKQPSQCNDPNGDIVAQGSFTISNNTGTPGGGTTTPPGTGVTPTLPSPTPSGGGTAIAGTPATAGGDPCNGARGPGFKTAIGCIHTNPAELIKDFLTFIIAISGGFAFLLMLLGAFGMITSAGNPEHLQAGRDRFQSAIIGLLFVIFAVLLFQILGANILKIKGF